MGVRVHRVANDHGLGPAFEDRDKGIVNILMHIDPRAVGTDFALGIEIGVHRRRHRIMDLAVVKND